MKIYRFCFFDIMAGAINTVIIISCRDLFFFFWGGGADVGVGIFFSVLYLMDCRKCILFLMYFSSRSKIFIVLLFKVLKISRLKSDVK